MFGHQYPSQSSSASFSSAINNAYKNKNDYNSYDNNINTNTHNHVIFDHHKSNGYHGKIIHNGHVRKSNTLNFNTKKNQQNFDEQITNDHNQLFRKSKQVSQPQWSFQVLPNLYSINQKVLIF